MSAFKTRIKKKTHPLIYKSPFTYRGKNSLEKNIVLDVDNTLITAIKVGNEYEPIARPHLKEFFEFIFAYFDNVSIWTHAEESWF